MFSWNNLFQFYFVPCSDFRREVKKIKCVRIPFKYYMPENMLTKEMEKVDKEQEREESGAEMWEGESGE